MTDAEFLAIAEKFVSRETAEKLLLTTRPALLATDQHPVELSSRVLTYSGGSPKPYPAHDWPEFQNVPMLFLIQLDLGGIPGGALPEVPAAGILQFYAADIWKFGGSIERVQESGAVRYFPPQQQWEVENVDPPHTPLPQMSVRLEARLTLPPSIDMSDRPGSNPMLPNPTLPRHLARIHLTWDEFNPFLDLRQEIRGYGPVQFGGFAPEVQSDMEPELPQYDAGGLASDVDFKLAARDEEILRGFDEWRLLCAYSNLADEDTTVMGTYYFWIHRERLARCDFSRVLLVNQFS